MADMTYWQNVNEAICGGTHKSEHLIKLFRYRARAKFGKPRKGAKVVVTRVSEVMKKARGE